MLLLVVAFFTIGERKLMGATQRRKGPDVVGFWGFLQPIADGVKLVFKEMIFPYKSLIFILIISPMFVFILSLTSWAVIPLSFAKFLTNINLSILITLIMGGLSIYGIILAGWSSNSRYAFLGSIRATAQMLSYELVLGTINLFIAFFAGSYNYTDIVNSQQNIWFFFPLLPLFFIYIIVMLAETNRTPFDLTEAEAELVAGYNVEYSSIMFAMFFLGEYANMILLSLICVISFFGGWLGGMLFFLIKVLFFCSVFVWVRATLPRYRYDQLMDLGWKHLLPFCFGLFIFFISICLVFDFRTSVPSLKQSIFYYIFNSQMNFPLFISNSSLFFLEEIRLYNEQFLVNNFLPDNNIFSEKDPNILLLLFDCPLTLFGFLPDNLSFFIDSTLFNDNTLLLFTVGITTTTTTNIISPVQDTSKKITFSPTIVYPITLPLYPKYLLNRTGYVIKLDYLSNDITNEHTYIIKSHPDSDVELFRFFTKKRTLHNIIDILSDKLKNYIAIAVEYDQVMLKYLDKFVIDINKLEPSVEQPLKNFLYKVNNFEDCSFREALDEEILREILRDFAFEFKLEVMEMLLIKYLPPGRLQIDFRELNLLFFELMTQIRILHWEFEKKRLRAIYPNMYFYEPDKN
jgi:NADH-quinone oxidoreductase subunit H